MLPALGTMLPVIKSNLCLSYSWAENSAKNLQAPSINICNIINTQSRKRLTLSAVEGVGGEVEGGYTVEIAI